MDLEQDSVMLWRGARSVNIRQMDLTVQNVGRMFKFSGRSEAPRSRLTSLTTEPARTCRNITGAKHLRDIFGPVCRLNISFSGQIYDFDKNKFVVGLVFSGRSMSSSLTAASAVIIDSSTNGKGNDDDNDNDKNKRPNPKKRKYIDSYIEFGFIDNDDGRPKCVLCLKCLAMEAMKPANLKRHLQSRHKEYAGKPKEFFV
ncbi:uncharacterized protein V6R79_009882 [Siganus canaliculatus]